MAHPAHSSPLERVLSRLKGVRSVGSDRWMAVCPTHDDKQASLSITVGKDGRTVMYCHAGCDTKVVVAAIGLAMTDLFATPRPTLEMASKPVPAQGVTTRPRLVATYDYYAADGKLAYQSCRFEPKTFRQRRRNGNGEWIYDLKGVTPILYRLPEVLEAVKQNRRVFVVEGEKDADALVALGYIATTSPMGAGKWRDAYSSMLAGADVVVLPDNDEPGQTHAEDVARSLTAHKATVKVVELPGLPPKGDVSDWIHDGHDVDELEELIGKARRWTGEEPGKRTRWRLDELWENDSIMRPPPAIVPRLAWAGRSTLFAAREKSGKSTLTGYIAAQVTRGGSFLGEPCAQGDVLVIGLEEYLGDAARRLRHFGAVATRVHLVDSFLGDPRTRPQELLKHIDATDPMLVIVDSLAAYSAGQVQDDNNASQMASVVQPLTDLAHSRGVALIIVHHARKSDGRARGSTAITAGTDVVCEYFAPEENTDPTLRRMRTAGRVPVQPVYDLRFDGSTYQLANEKEGAPLDARILGVVQDRPSIGINDLVEAVRARKEDVSRTVLDMLAKGTLANLSDSNSRVKLTVPARSNLAFLHDG